MASHPNFLARPLKPLAAIFGDPHQALLAAETLRQQGQRDSPAVVCYPDDPDLAAKIQGKMPAAAGSPWSDVSVATAAPGVAIIFCLAALMVALGSVGGAPSGLSALFVVLIWAAAFISLTCLVRLPQDRSEVEMDVREALLDGHWAVVAHPRDQADRQASSHSMRLHGGEVL